MVSRTYTNLAEQVQGVLPVANGGTGSASLTSGSLLVGSGTSVVTSVAPGAAGNVLKSTGSAWASTAPLNPATALPWAIRNDGDHQVPLAMTWWQNKASTTTPTTAADTGQTAYYVYNSATGSQVSGGAWQMYGASGSNAAAYRCFDTSAPITRIGCRFAFTAAGTTGNGAVLLSTANQTFTVTSGVIGSAVKLNMHLSIAPTAWSLTTYYNGTFNALGSGNFNTPLLTNGTVYECEVYRNGNVITMCLPDGTVQAITDGSGNASAWAGNTCFFETYQLAASTDDTPVIVEEWWDNTTTTPVVPTQQVITTQTLNNALNGSIYPQADNTYYLGSSSKRYSQVWAAAAVINTLYANGTLYIESNTGQEVTLSPASGLSAAQTITMPNTTTADTLVGRASTDTLTNKTLVAPVLGTPASGTLTNCTGLPLASLDGPGASGNVAVSNGTNWTSTALSNANINAAIDIVSTSQTMSASYSAYVFTGSSAITLILPAPSSTTGVVFWIENRGTAAVTVTSSSGNQIWYQTAVNSMIVQAGGSLELMDDGTYWNALSVDLTNNVVGLLPVVNGGTGQNSLTNLPLTTPTITGYTETVQALGTVGGTKTLPALSGGTIMTATLTSGTPCTFTMPTGFNGAQFVLCLVQPASGTATTATFTGATWPAVGAPTITPTLAKWDILTFIYANSTWCGSYVQGF